MPSQDGIYMPITMSVKNKEVKKVTTNTLQKMKAGW